MITIVCAVYCEASPIIEALKLKRNQDEQRFELYSGENISLIISGLGKLRSAVATTYALSLHSEHSRSLVCNLGVCGAKSTFERGQLLYPNKITDSALNKSYYPDILLKHGCKEVHLLTVDRPYLTSDISSFDFDIVDMEGSGFFEAALTFTPSSQISSFKIVSDHGVDAPLKKEDVTALITPHVDHMLNYFKNLSTIIDSKPNPLTLQDEDLLKKLSLKLKLTRYQSFSLNKLAFSYKIRTSNDLEVLTPFLEIKPEDKNEVKSTFKSIRNVLTAT